eukprot:1138709-Pelagomonas_calceolata.AAC.3
MKEQFGQLDLKHYGKRVLQSAWLCKGAECAAGPEVFETHKMFFQSAWLCKGAEYAAGPEVFAIDKMSPLKCMVVQGSRAAWLCKGAERAAGPEVFETDKTSSSKCMVVQGAERAAETVHFSKVVSEEYRIVHVAHLHLQEQCSYPAATLLQLHCCRRLLHAIVLYSSTLSGQTENPCGNMRDINKLLVKGVQE